MGFLAEELHFDVAHGWCLIGQDSGRTRRVNNDHVPGRQHAGIEILRSLQPLLLTYRKQQIQVRVLLVFFQDMLHRLKNSGYSGLVVPAQRRRPIGPNQIAINDRLDPPTRLDLIQVRRKANRLPARNPRPESHDIPAVAANPVPRVVHRYFESPLT
ncbi:hypothetical protein SDC9_183932 [bioreactor metagenome]|uniref:Uncharacterized protein n=1 Tax=bioreactor metagenome TaxID=1076179 RepID=A0A645HLC8_9ZZZZ